MSLDYAVVRSRCAVNPNYEKGTAYDRTMICCEILLEDGQAIPSWMVIREIIGKGSAQDIRRGVQNFRREHGERLRKMQGVTPGVPESLAPHVRGLWEAAVAAARAEFDTNVQQWQQRIEQATIAAEQSGRALSEAQTLLQTTQSELEIRDKRIGSLEAEVKALESAVEKLTGEQREWLQQIETAQRERSVLDQTLTQLSAKVAAADKRNAVLDQQNADLHARLQRAESQTDRLTEDNRKMIATLNDLNGPVTKGSRRSAKSTRSSSR
jgi:DNA repair exonuclease SbcCD ATPase subunit